MEHGIIVIKPDGMEQNIKQLLEDSINNYNLKIIASYRERLTYTQCKKIFSTTAFDENEYYTYLSSDYMHFLLIRGDYAISKLRELKYKIRTDFNCEKNMCNLMHTSDTGNEYKSQLKALFINHSYEEYPLFADLHMSFASYISKKKRVCEANGIIIDCEEIKKLKGYDLCNKLIGVRTKCRFQDKLIPVICYIKGTDWYFKAIHLGESRVNISEYIKSANEINGICIVDYIPFIFWEHALVRALKDEGIKGFKVYDPRYSMQQLEVVKYFVQYRYKMIATGGSAYEESLLTIDQELYQGLLYELTR